MRAMFGTAGNPDRFQAEGFKASKDMPLWLKGKGLDAYEYQCGKGVSVGEATARAIGEKAARIADGAAQSGGEVLHFSTKEEALKTLKEELKPGTAMLVKASHAMHFGALVDALQKDYD